VPTEPASEPPGRSGAVSREWSVTTGPPLPDRFKTGGLPDPREAALQGFAADAHAYVVGVRYEDPAHAIVQVGFPDKAPFYWLNIYRHDDGWRMERPPDRY
jgi:hypothetical protein